MQKTIFIAILLLGLSFHLWAQTPITGDIQARITTIINNMPLADEEDYVVPTTAEQNDWKSMIAHILNYQIAIAAGEATALGYELFAFTDNTVVGNRLYYLLEEMTPSTKYWGTYIFNPSPCRPDLVLQAPHAKYDFNTGKEAIYVFHEIEARAFLMTGTHRCNVSATSSCTGTSKVCSANNTSEPYRQSDMSHVTESMFQATTEQIMNTVPASKFIQLHGFTKKSTDPYLIMSNGTNQTPTVDYMPTLRDELFAIDNVLTFKIPHIDIGWTRLVGFWNTQGRMINGESTPCTSSATSTNGHFFHIEQEKNRLRANQTGWAKMAVALANTFPCSALPVEEISFTGSLTFDQKVSLQWTVGVEKYLRYYEIERSPNGNTFERIARLNAGRKDFYHYIDVAPLSGNSFYRLKMIDQDGTFSYSNTIYLKTTIKENIWQLSPNPFSSDLMITAKNWQGKQIQLYDVLGRPIKTHIFLNDASTTLDCSTMNKGTYWILLFDREKNLLGRKQVVKY